jgi:hypothetical protein
MKPLRLATYNVEWFNALFDDDGNLLDDIQRSARHDITRGEQLAALAAVFTAMDADGVMIIEAPDTGSRCTASPQTPNKKSRFSMTRPVSRPPTPPKGHPPPPTAMRGACSALTGCFGTT